MNRQNRKRAIRLSMLVPLGGALAFAAAGLALAAPAAPKAPAVVYRVTAQLTAAQETPASTASTSAKGRFDALLVRAGPGQSAKVGSLPTGCKVVNPPPRSGRPATITCDNGRLTLPLPKAAGWVLAWRLTFSGLTGPATAAHIHVGVQGHAGPVVIPLCGPCASSVKGVVHVTAAQAAVLLSGGDYANVHTNKNMAGEIRGQIRKAAH